MRVLVTGGAGFIGGHLAESFTAAGHDVIVLDNFDPYYDPGIKEHTVTTCRETADASDGTYTLVRGDIRDADRVAEATRDADIVYHQAAQAGVRTSVENPRKPHDINATGTLIVLDAARAHDVDRVVVAGSSSVYGRPEYLPYDETHPTQPVSPYGVSKLAADHYARVYHDLYSLPTVTLRYFTVYGPRMRPNMAISNFVSRCINGNPPVVYGDGQQTRDFTYITDVVDANHTLLASDAADGQTLNIGSTTTIDIQTLAETVRDLIDPNIPIEYDDPRQGDADHTHADVTKATSLLGYQPTTPIREGIKRFLEWYEANRSWYEPLVLRS